MPNAEKRGEAKDWFSLMYQNGCVGHILIASHFKSDHDLDVRPLKETPDIKKFNVEEEKRRMQEIKKAQENTDEQLLAELNNLERIFKKKEADFAKNQKELIKHTNTVKIFKDKSHDFKLQQQMLKPDNVKLTTSVAGAQPPYSILTHNSASWLVEDARDSLLSPEGVWIKFDFGSFPLLIRGFGIWIDDSDWDC